MAPTTRSSRNSLRAELKADYTNKSKPKAETHSSRPKSKPKSTTTNTKVTKSTAKPKAEAMVTEAKGTKRGNDAEEEEEESEHEKSVQEETEEEEEEQPSKKKQKTTTKKDDAPTELKQTTLDESIITGKDDKNSNEMVDEGEKIDKDEEKEMLKASENMDVEKEEKKQETNSTESSTPTKPSNTNGANKSKSNTNESNGNESHNPPSSINEKGLLYFFTRSRVGIDGPPQNFTDIQRSYIIMRPIALQSAIPTSGEIGDKDPDSKKDEGLMRVLAVPKKKLLGTGGRFLTFIEKSSATIDSIKNDVLCSSTYNTQTMGERTNPPALPLGTAVYAITQAGRTSHLIYHVVHDPSSDGLTPFQKDFGLKDKGSFAISVKNPTAKSAPGQGLDNDPGYSKELQDAFGDRRWNSVDPAYLNYDGAEILFIGEKGVEDKDDGGEGDEVEDELDKMAEEDEERIKELSEGRPKEDDGIFEDLELSKKEFGEGMKVEW